jgi:hypothetical protein
MKNKLYLFIIVSSIFFNLQLNGQTLINWEWKHLDNISYQDIEYKNNFIYAVGNFTSNTVTIGSNTYVNAGGNDIIICKMDTLGNLIWSNHFGSSGNESLNSICVDNNGNVLAIGTMQGTLNVGSYILNSIGGYDILMSKLDSNGNVLLAKNVGTVGNENGFDITTDYNNDIYAVGNKSINNLNFASTNNIYNNVILKWSSVGTELFMNYMRGGLSGQSASGSTTLIKYSAYDSTIIIGGGIYSGSSALTNYYFCNSSNLNLTVHINASPSWGAKSNSYFCKTNLNGVAQKLDIYDPSYISSISDLTTNPINGDFYFTNRVHYPLSGNDYNNWIKGNVNLTNFAILPINLSIQNQTQGSSFYGMPIKINYFNNSLYGLLYQQYLNPNVICSDYYAAKFNLATNVSELKMLDYGQTYISGVGFNGTFCMGGSTISKSCQANCVVPFSLNPALDKAICTNSVVIGFPDCYYVKGGTPPYSYLWSPSTGLSATNVIQPTVTGISSSMTYTLTVIDQTGNIIYDTVNVVISNVSSHYDTAIICSYQLPYLWLGHFYNSPTPLNSYYLYQMHNIYGCDSNFYLKLIVNQNSFSSISISICPNQIPYNFNGQILTQAGTYHDTLQNAVGCDSIATLNLIVNQATTSITNAGVCLNQLPYTWNGQNYTSVGVYTYQTTNATGCDSIATLNLIVNQAPQPQIILNNFNLICTNINAINYEWFFNNNSVINNNDTLSITQNGTYIVITTDSTGCVGVDTFQVSALGFTNFSTNFNNIQLYPNPTSNSITLSYTLLESSPISIKLFDITGKIIAEISKNENQAIGNHTKEINLQKLRITNGVYLLQINDGIRNWNQRVVYQE